MSNYNKFILILAIFNFFIRIFFIQVPSFADETNYNYSALAIAKNNLNPFTNYYSYKPPLLYEPVAVLFKVITPSRIWGRLLTYIYSSLSLYLIYQIGKKLFNELAGFYSSILLFSYPLFSAQSFLYTGEVAITAYFLLSIYFYISKKYFLYAVATAFMVMTKESMILITITLFLFECYYLLRNKKKDVLLIFYFFLPIVIFVCWIIANKILLGFYLNPNHINIVQKVITGDLFNHSTLSWVFNSYYLHNFTWLLFVLIIINLILPYTSKRFELLPSHKKVYIMALLLFHFYGILNYFFIALARYLLFSYTLIVLVFSHCIVKMKINEKFKLPLCISICILFSVSNLLSLLTGDIAIDNDVDFRFFKNIQIHQQVTKILERNYLDRVIITSWPLSNYIGDFFHGYVKTPLNVITPSNCIEDDFIPLSKFSFIPSPVIVNSPINCQNFQVPDDTKKTFEIRLDKYLNSEYTIKIYSSIP